ncbi:adenine deaminase [bacterium]|jgi:adenine deaminase|nr:adenine deaminase [bacterium]
MKVIRVAAGSLKARIDASQGRIPCDRVLLNARWLDVFTCTWKSGAISIFDGVIVGVDEPLPAKETLDLGGAAVVPGFIDAHVHIESSLMTPGEFEKSTLPRGTTAAICDPHEIANVVGLRGIEWFLECAERMQLDLRVMLSSCVPASHLETNGAGILTGSDLGRFQSHRKVLGLAEMMNFPGVIHGDPEVLSKLEQFSHQRIDGHSPLLRGQALSSYLVGGASSCHECVFPEEAAEKISKGMSVWIREGSVARDLELLIPLLKAETSTSIGFCTDDRNPLDIREQGHIDYLIREAIRRGTAPELAFRAASWSVARHYSLDKNDIQGNQRMGAVAPGYAANLVVLNDVASVAIREVFQGGEPASSLRYETLPAHSFAGTVRIAALTEADFVAPTGRVHIIDVLPGRILTGRHVGNSDDPGVARLTVIERYGHGQKPAHGYLKGFGENFSGAIASTVGHDSHNLIIVGTSSRDMRVAAEALAASGGGFCVVRDGTVLSQLALPIGGLMTDESPAEIHQKLNVLKQAARSIGCELHEPFLQLAFLSLPVIPSLKLTNLGLVDVDRFEIIPLNC